MKKLIIGWGVSDKFNINGCICKGVRYGKVNEYFVYRFFLTKMVTLYENAASSQSIRVVFVFDEELENTMKRLSKKTIEEAEKDMLDEEKLSRQKKHQKKEEKVSLVALEKE